MMPSPRDRPAFDGAAAEALVLREWGDTVRATELEGDIDRNFRLDGERTTLLKVAPVSSVELPLEIRSEAAARAAREPGAPGLSVPLPARGNRPLVTLSGSDGRPCAAVRSTWLEGVPLARYRPKDHDLLHRLGGALAAVGRGIAALEHPALDRDHPWDLRRASSVIERNAGYVRRDRRPLFDRSASRAVAGVRAAGRLPVQPIHGDANDYNVLVSPAGDEPAIALIDFGDMVRSWRVADPAIAAAYAAMDVPDPVGAIAALAAGYDRVLPLADAELDAFIHLVALRLCASVAHSAHRAAAEPDDPYLVVSEGPAWDLLKRLDEVHPRLAGARIRAACGRPASSAGSSLDAWLRSGTSNPAFPLDSDGRVHVLDLSVGGAHAEPEYDPSDADAWTVRIQDAVRVAGAAVGLGRYLEPRLCYGGDQFATGGREPEFQRTVHLGVDLFAPAGTTVRAAYDGTVASVSDNRAPLDYGPTVLLHHEEAGERPAFWTLFGHLDPDVLDRLKVGARVERGSAIARLGSSADNGGWPPHLHYQVIADRLDRDDGNFPGVALPSESEAWAAICPEPDLGIDAAAGYEAPPDLHRRRRKRIAPSLGLSYRRPLHIVRGFGVFLYDERGRRYLDGVNNVCHVGHAHPGIVEAAARQMARLNTNTRYLHRAIVEYGERLTALLPAGLDTCFFVNSGSEANDLALRLARSATGARGVVALAGAYHGHLSSLIDVSPYKFDGPGGAGRADHVRVVRSPDPYRGAIRANDRAAGEAYAEDVREAARSLREDGPGLAAFIAEALPSCGGQIVPPPGYLEAAARHTRAAGGLYIADEVQTGFGRVGSRFWAFELQDVVPDIVTMGKPIGNGHPLGAVVTTRAIAEAFDPGMEYFNTYGGNPVSCEVGLAVLDVVRDERLQDRALAVGARLMTALDDLRKTHPCVGDVRGHGLFIGIEVVDDPERRTPAAAAASWIVNRARDLGVLLSTDGPDHNVIKIKPPLVFGDEHADRLVDVLRTILADDYLRTPTDSVV